MSDYFHTEKLLKNWFPVELPDACFTDGALVAEVEGWLKENARLPYVVEFGSDGVTKNEQFAVHRAACRILFRAGRDASLFKLFWGGA